MSSNSLLELAEPLSTWLNFLFDKASFIRQNTTSRLALDFSQDVIIPILTIVKTATGPSSASVVSRPDRFWVHPASCSLGISDILRILDYPVHQNIGFFLVSVVIKHHLYRLHNIPISAGPIC